MLWRTKTHGRLRSTYLSTFKPAESLHSSMLLREEGWFITSHPQRRFGSLTVDAQFYPTLSCQLIPPLMSRKELRDLTLHLWLWWTFPGTKSSASPTSCSQDWRQERQCLLMFRGMKPRKKSL